MLSITHSCKVAQLDLDVLVMLLDVSGAKYALIAGMAGFASIFTDRNKSQGQIWTILLVHICAIKYIQWGLSNMPNHEIKGVDHCAICCLKMITSIQFLFASSILKRTYIQIHVDQGAGLKKLALSRF